MTDWSVLTDWSFLTDWSVLTDQIFVKDQCLDTLEYLDIKYPISVMESYWVGGGGGWCIWIIASALVPF